MYDTYRQVTPPAGVQYFEPHDVGSERHDVGSERTSSPDFSFQSYDTSPQSISTQTTTPPRSPVIVKQGGPQLLPRVRTQDQTVQNATTPIHKRNNSSFSSSTGFPVDFNPFGPSYRRSVSPAECTMLTPVSEAGYQFPSAQLSNARLSEPPSFSRSRSHSRTSSTTNIDESAMRKYICPSTRGMPEYITRASSVPATTTAPTTTAPTTSSVNTLPPIAPSAHHHQPSNTNVLLNPELLFDNYPSTPRSTTMLDYLTAPNPSPGLVRRNTVPNRQFDLHFWWDVRNIRTWSDFSLETIHKIPNLTSLLEFPVPEPALPLPEGKTNLEPETLSALHDAHTTHYVTKVNAALKVALGTSPLAMRAAKHTHAGSRPPPDFLANYAADFERTISGTVKGRVVGLVRSFSTWNSGMHAAGPAAKIDYLRELASLHSHMREHGCRYGFILTEIELVCVRMGAEAVPYFGYLELSNPIQLDASGRDTLTAPLALWYLHMLAKDRPLSGQCGYKVDVGGPAALTRKNHLERDKWMLKPEGREKRDAKRNRGWVLPDEPLSRKECGKPKRWSR